MNLFILDENIKKSVSYYCDKHIVKMILESAQMLCTVQRLYHNDNPLLYKSTHINHPCVKWCSQSVNNYNYLLIYWIEMNKEYSRRYNKIHKSYIKLIDVLSILPEIKEREFTLPPSVMPKEFLIYDVPTNLEEVVQNYRNYYSKEKIKIASWNHNTSKPYWILS